jgi:carboxyl-terminal processing protease
LLLGTSFCCALAALRRVTPFNRKPLCSKAAAVATNCRTAAKANWPIVRPTVAQSFAPERSVATAASQCAAADPQRFQTFFRFAVVFTVTFAAVFLRIQSMEKKKLTIWLPLLLSGMMVVGMMVGYKLHSNVHGDFFGKKKNSAVQEVMELVEDKYVDPVTTDTMSYDAIQSMLLKLDPHSVFIPPVELEEVERDMQGGFEGVGIEFQVFDDTANVLSVLKDGPSDKAGLQTGDKMLLVGDSVVTGTKLKDNRLLHRLLQGEGGSKVKLTVLRDQNKKMFEVTRGLIPLPAVSAAYLLPNNIGYIKLNKFSENTYKEFMTRLEKLNPTKLKSFVLDLRGNGGGLMSEAVAIADECIAGDKLVVYTEGRKREKQEYFCKLAGQLEATKLVVLVDEGTASASEVLSGALQDYDRATIVGRRSFGKGLVQEQFGLSNGSALRLTVARYYTPLGRSIQKSYAGGHDVYEKEVMKRFEAGELTTSDTLYKPQGKTFRTAGGKLLYGGGGIMPDVYVKFDTALNYKTLNSLVGKKTFSRFAYYVYLQDKALILQQKTIADYIKNYNPSIDKIALLQNLAARDSVALPTLSMPQQQKLLDDAKAAIARYLWRDAGYTEVSNAKDAMMAKALEILSK